MAKVNKTALHDFVTGEFVREEHLDQTFEVLRVAINDTDDRVTNLQAQTNQNTTGITTKADKTYVDQQDAALQAQITANRIDIDTHTAEIQSLNSMIAGLQNITADKVDKIYVDSQDANLQTEIDALEGRVTQVETVKADRTYVDQQIANVQAGQIGDHTIGTDKLVDGAVTTPKLADGAVTANKVDGTTVLTATQINALIAGITPASIGAAPADHTHTAGDVGALPVDSNRRSNLDLNTVTTPGVYALAGNLLNGPGIEWGTLIVAVSGDVVNQLIWNHENRIAVRGCSGFPNNPVWQPWLVISDFVRKDQVNTFTQRQTFAAGITDGDSNTDVSLINSVQHQVHTRSTVLTYSGGRLTEVEEKNGATVVKTTTLSYDGNGRLSSVVETAGGVTRTSTLNYDGFGNLISVTRT